MAKATQTDSTAKTAKPVDYKSRMQWKVTAMLAVALISFMVFFIPTGVQSKLVKQFGEVQKYSAGIMALTGAPLVFFVRWVIFAQDHLATGNGRASRFFRHYYPSCTFITKHGVDGNVARKLWFEFYNKWQKPNHKHYDLFRRNSERTYSMRMIWYLKRILLAYLLLALVAMSLDCWLFERQEFVSLLPVKVVLLFGAAVMFVSIQFSNTITEHPASPDYFDRYTATGAYEKYKEIQGYVWVLFEEEEVSKWQKAQAKKT